MASTEIRDRRRILRYRNLVVRQSVQMKNRISGLLMETGVSYNKRRLHKVGYFADLMATSEEIQDCIRPLLRLSREHIERAQKLDYALVSSLERDPLLKERLRRLRTVPGVGPITALTWALEIGDFTRFGSIKEAISYCGLCGDENSSADKVMRMPLSGNATSISSGCWWRPPSWHPRVPRTGSGPPARAGERKSQPGHAGRGQENGVLLAGGRARPAGLRACRAVLSYRGSVKTLPKKGKTSGSFGAQTARSRP